jgi:hypothetical protein
VKAGGYGGAAGFQGAAEAREGAAAHGPVVEGARNINWFWRPWVEEFCERRERMRKREEEV